MSSYALLKCYMHQVLSAGDDMVGLEQLDEDADDIALHKARRTMGSMSTMSGAKGMVYMEYRYCCIPPHALVILCVHMYRIRNHNMGKRNEFNALTLQTLILPCLITFSFQMQHRKGQTRRTGPG